MNDDYKLFLNEKFDRLFKELEIIREQVTRTNGRVTKLEKDEILHYQSCPNNIKIEEINNEMLEYKMFKKYPKFFLVAFGIISLLLIISIII